MSETPLPSRLPFPSNAPLMNRWMPSFRSVCSVPAGMISSQRVFQTDRPINRVSVIVSAGLMDGDALIDFVGIGTNLSTIRKVVARELSYFRYYQ